MSLALRITVSDSEFINCTMVPLDEASACSSITVAGGEVVSGSLLIDEVVGAAGSAAAASSFGHAFCSSLTSLGGRGAAFSGPF